MTYTFKLENPDGTPADPPSIRLGVYQWQPGTRSRSAGETCAWSMTASANTTSCLGFISRQACDTIKFEQLKGLVDEEPRRRA